MGSSGGELEFQREVDKDAAAAGWVLFALPVVQKVRTPARLKGWPDRCYFKNGRILVLEFKAEKGDVVSAEQEEWIARWRKVAERVPNTVKVEIVKPSQIADVRRWLGIR